MEKSLVVISEAGEETAINLTDLVFAQIAALVASGGTLPTPAQIRDDALAMESRPNAFHAEALVKAGRRAMRSKRKIVMTALGPCVAILMTAVAGGPITAAVVGLAVAGAAMGILATKTWRNGRYYYFQEEYKACFEKIEGGYGFRSDKDALNAVRFCLEKKQLSQISDEVAVLFKALAKHREVNEQRAERPTCRDFANRIYAAEKVRDAAAKLQQQFDLFHHFHEYVRCQLEQALKTGTDALHEHNIADALQRASDWVNRPMTDHRACVSWTSGCCFATEPGDPPKPRSPKVRTTRTLSARERRPFVRLMNDAAYRTRHGEDLATASYTDQTDWLCAELAGTGIGALLDGREPEPPDALPADPPASTDLGRRAAGAGSAGGRRSLLDAGARAEGPTHPSARIRQRVATDPGIDTGPGAAPARLKRAASEGSFDRLRHAGPAQPPAATPRRDERWEDVGVRGLWDRLAFVTGDVLHYQMERTVNDPNLGLRLGVATGAAAVGVEAQAGLALSKGGHHLSSIGPALAKSAGTTISTSVGGIVLAAARWAVDDVNLRNEFAALKEELAHERLEDMNIPRLMAALRTLLKDGQIFDHCVEEVGKVLEYHREFALALSRTDPTCNDAWELVYRPLKAIKHLETLNQHLPLVSLYAAFANWMSQLADQVETQDLPRLRAELDEWLKHPVAHRQCGNDICYAHLAEEEEPQGPAHE